MSVFDVYHRGKQRRFLFLCLMSLGVVFGDIGTSPLYTEGEMFFPLMGAGVPLTPAHIIGANSVMVWSLFLIVGVFYCMFALRADHHGEGGVLALYAKLKDHPLRLIPFLLLLGAGLLIGDGAITPPISILGGLEGVSVAAPFLVPWIVPLALCILLLLFAFQRRGTASIGLSFGPIMLTWFLAIAGIGAAYIARRFDILSALNPIVGVRFLMEGGTLSMKVHFLGAAFLAVTGGEALYADLGHFRKGAIRAVFAFVFLCLVLSYLGQAAYVLDGGNVAAGNVFYSSVRDILGDGGVYAMIILGTLAAVIASQALITGMFSIVALAMALRLLPKVRTFWTSEEHRGQIYQPVTNWVLCAACCVIVLSFRSTKQLAAAYGLAVSLLMLFTSFSLPALAHREWRWPLPAVVVVFAPFVLLVAAFVAANAAKFSHGGYVPLLVAVAVLAIMTTWRWGTECVAVAMEHFCSRDVAWLLRLRERKRRDVALAGVDRSVVFLTSRSIRRTSDGVPSALRAFIKRYGALPSRILFLRVHIDADRPRVRSEERFDVRHFGREVRTVIARYGYREVQDIHVRRILLFLYEMGRIPVPADEWEFEISEEEIIAGADLLWHQRWRLRLFRLLRTISTPAHHFFGLFGDPGVSHTLIPVRFSRRSAEVCMPDTV
ncbi:KUP/HAK/KT family potassium transporter [Candidatus Peregrinibacteria bacterium]|nr:KUP/HAK/KT family potassium transporter [Candidatus Peregrinibacteria bacterium]